MPSKKQLNLCIEVDVLTAGTAAEVVNAILESLLYQRNQIPFVYKTYRYYVNKWMDESAQNKNVEAEITGIHSFQAQRQKQQATMTKEAISSMREIIKDSFENKSIKSLRFLFGSTTFTAKEAYTIHIPTANISMNHKSDHHRISSAKLNQTLISLLTSEDLYAIFSYNLSPTNIYLEFEVLENISLSCSTTPAFGNSTETTRTFPKDFSPLPASCKDIHLHLLHKRSPDFNHKQLQCCKELRVYEDIMHLSLESDSKFQDDSAPKSLTSGMPAWWEAEVVIRGFKDQPIKGFNMWS